MLDQNIREGLHFLAETGLVEKIKQGRHTKYRATKLGIRLARLYLKPTSAKPIIDMLKLWAKQDKIVWNAKLQVEALLATVMSPENRSTIRKLLGKFENLINYVYSHNHILSLISEKFLDENLLTYLTTERKYLTPDEEEFLAVLGGVCMLHDWISGRPASEILNEFIPNFGPGDLHELTRVSDWLIYCMSELASVLGLPVIIIERLKTLSKMVRYGVPEDLLEIVEEVEGIGRIRALALKRAGFDSLEKIAKASIETLKRVEGIGDVLAKRLKDVARRKIGF